MSPAPATHTGFACALTGGGTRLFTFDTVTHSTNIQHWLTVQLCAVISLWSGSGAGNGAVRYHAGGPVRQQTACTR